MRFLETTDGTLIAGDMIKSVHWTDVDDCRRIVTKDDNAYTVSNFRWALFQNDELPVIPAQPGWFLVGVWHEAASVGDHTLVPIVGWRIDGTMATPIATEPVESDYAMLAPNGTVYGAHEVYWRDIDEFMREKLGKPEGISHWTCGRRRGRDLGRRDPRRTAWGVSFSACARGLAERRFGGARLSIDRA